MASKIRLSYPTRLFMLLLGFAWALVICFLVFQYSREKQFKVEALDGQLQIINSEIIGEITAGKTAQQAMQELCFDLPSLRVTVVNLRGDVIYDNSLDTLPSANHQNRPEIAQAIASGRGYTLRRHSSTTNATYFYSATRGADVVVRSALPYDLTLASMLKADSSFLWFMLAVTSVLSVIAYFATRRIGSTIRSLNLFAEKAEKGEQIYDDVAFPSDELGSISNHITRLYARLQQTIADRDAQHRAALHEEQEKIRIKKQLTNNINHELKTPVASMQVCLETLLSHPDLPDAKRTEFIERCYANAERLRQLLVDVSTITRMDDGASQISRERICVSDIIAEVVTEMTECVTAAGMTIHNDVPEGITIDGNRQLVSSIFRNLIENAAAYSEGSRIDIHLERHTDTSYVFSLADDGKGVDSEHLERIFERFYRIDKGRSRPKGGTGLGLSIVKNAVMMHGGAIKAKNQRSEGLKFIFSLAK